MQKIKGNEQISITLTGKLENGEIFTETQNDNPLTLTLGSNTLFSELERALTGMEPGETRTVQIPAEYAYGLHHKNLVQSISKSVFGSHLDPKPGMILALNLENNGTKQQVPATVISSSKDTIIVDYNHPLAGKPLIYTVTLHRIITS